VNQYRVTVEVDYIVSASSMSEAMTIVDQHSEHPLVGQGADSWCDDIQVIAAMIDNRNKETV
jgi:uncharacterized protein with PIN domain